MYLFYQTNRHLDDLHVEILRDNINYIWYLYIYFMQWTNNANCYRYVLKANDLVCHELSYFVVWSQFQYNLYLDFKYSPPDNCKPFGIFFAIKFHLMWLIPRNWHTVTKIFCVQITQLLSFSICFDYLTYKIKFASDNSRFTLALIVQHQNCNVISMLTFHAIWLHL